METLERYLLVSAIVLFVFVFYRWLLKYLRRNELQGSFSYVYPFEINAEEAPRDIKFEIPASSEVRGALFRTDGEEVRELFNGVFEKGTHSRDIDYRSLDPGEYHLKLFFPNQVVERTINLK